MRFGSPDESIDVLIRDYTREAGVRQLNRELNRLCRALALEVVAWRGAVAQSHDR